MLIAAILVPFILAVSEGSSWGWLSLGTLGCLAVSAAAAYGFVRVESRVRAPLLDLRLLRNRVLVGGTLVILIGAAALNALMYLLSIYLQDPNTLALSPLRAGVATLPATLAMLAITPLVSPLAIRLGTRQIIGVGFVLMAAGFGALTFVHASWAYGCSSCRWC